MHSTGTGGTTLRLTIRACVAVLAVTSASGQSAQSLATAEWTRAIPPFRIVGNEYWVGTYDLASCLITTPAGHILINSGLAQTVPDLRNGLEKLGFRVADVKILTATHGHFDHVAGLAELKKMTGAQVVMSKADTDLLESGGKTDFRFGTDPTAWFAPVKVDRQLQDGDRIELGGFSMTVHLQPGHTRGATSYTFEVNDGGRRYRVAIVNMASINPGVRLAGMPGFMDIADAYAKTFRAKSDAV